MTYILVGKEYNSGLPSCQPLFKISRANTVQLHCVVHCEQNTAAPNVFRRTRTFTKVWSPLVVKVLQAVKHLGGVDFTVNNKHASSMQGLFQLCVFV